MFRVFPIFLHPTQTFWNLSLLPFTRTSNYWHHDVLLASQIFSSTSNFTFIPQLIAIMTPSLPETYLIPSSLFKSSHSTPWPSSYCHCDALSLPYTSLIPPRLSISSHSSACSSSFQYLLDPTQTFWNFSHLPSTRTSNYWHHDVATLFYSFLIPPRLSESIHLQLVPLKSSNYSHKP